MVKESREERRARQQALLHAAREAFVANGGKIKTVASQSFPTPAWLAGTVREVHPVTRKNGGLGGYVVSLRLSGSNDEMNVFTNGEFTSDLIKGCRYHVHIDANPSYDRKSIPIESCRYILLKKPVLALANLPRFEADLK